MKYRIIRYFIPDIFVFQRLERVGVMHTRLVWCDMLRNKSYEEVKLVYDLHVKHGEFVVLEES